MPTWYDDDAPRARAEGARRARAGSPSRRRSRTRTGSRTSSEAHGHDDDRTRRRIFHAVRRHAHLLHAPESALWTGAAARRSSTRIPSPSRSRCSPRAPSSCAATSRPSGPATRADIADWSGLRVADFAPALDALEPLRRFRDENGRELLDLPRAPLPPADTPAPVRFLPKWDNTLLAHADRRRVLPEELRKAVIGKNGDVDADLPRRRHRRGLVDGGQEGQDRARAVRAAPPRRAPRGRGRGGAPGGVAPLASTDVHRRAPRPRRAASTPRSTAPRRSAPSRCRSSRRARAPWRPTNHDPATFEPLPRAPRRRSGSHGVLCHALYLCNFAAPNDEVYEKSVAALRNTMEVACAIGADGVVFHVGSHLGAGLRARARARRCPRWSRCSSSRPTRRGC